jgi:hypothetical protein
MQPENIDLNYEVDHAEIERFRGAQVLARSE